MFFLILFIGCGEQPKAIETSYNPALAEKELADLRVEYLEAEQKLRCILQLVEPVEIVSGESDPDIFVIEEESPWSFDTASLGQTMAMDTASLDIDYYPQVMETMITHKSVVKNDPEYSEKFKINKKPAVRIRTIKNQKEAPKECQFLFEDTASN